MPDIVRYIATSLDGYIATPDGRVDWLFELNPRTPVQNSSQSRSNALHWNAPWRLECPLEDLPQK